MADSALITPESAPEEHARLLAIWENEHRPGYVVMANHTYRVQQRSSDHVYVFQELSNKSMYESTGF